MERAKLVMPYHEMVQRLFKQQDLPMMYLHAGIGIVGEVIEYKEVLQCQCTGTYSERKKQVVEELGDITFYLQAMLNLHGSLRLEDFHDSERADRSDLLIDAGEILDACKRYAIYNKPLETERLHTHVKNVITCLHTEFRIWDFKLIEVQVANQDKLLTGEKARYALGIYTDEQAQARADKN